MNRTFAALVGLCLIVPFAGAQDFQPITYSGTVSWVPAGDQNGVESSVDISIRYDLYMGEPTRRATGKATIGDRVHYNGQVYTRTQVGDEIFDDFDFGVINVEADIFVGTAKISTVRFSNLISNDIAGSPNWDAVFPGVGADAAKEAFRSRFTIQNVRMVDVKNRIFQVESWVREQEREKAYADAMARARQLEQAGDLAGAQAAYNEATRAKPGDCPPHYRLRCPALPEHWPRWT